MKKAIYPGTFDPITYGHLDVLHRGCKLFDQVILAVADNTAKNTLFSQEERIELILGALVSSKIPFQQKVEVASLDGLTVDFAQQKGASVIIRGLRAVSDFEYEFQMAQMNRHLCESIETLFLMPNEAFFFTSSQLIKAVATHDSKRIQSFVPPDVIRALELKVKTLNKTQIK